MVLFHAAAVYFQDAAVADGVDRRGHTPVQWRYAVDSQAIENRGKPRLLWFHCSMSAIFSARMTLFISPDQTLRMTPSASMK